MREDLTLFCGEIDGIADPGRLGAGGGGCKLRGASASIAVHVKGTYGSSVCRCSFTSHRCIELPF